MARQTTTNWLKLNISPPKRSKHKLQRISTLVSQTSKNHGFGSFKLSDYDYTIFRISFCLFLFYDVKGQTTTHWLEKKKEINFSNYKTVDSKPFICDVVNLLVDISLFII